MTDTTEDAGGILEPVEPGTVEPFPPYLIRDAAEDVQKMGEGLPSGFDELEELDLRWAPGKLYAVMARPNHGKTTFLLECLMRHARAIRPGMGPAVFVTYEEHRAEIVNRLLRREVARERFERAGGKGEASGAGRDIVVDWLRRGGLEDDPDGHPAYHSEIVEAGRRLDALSMPGPDSTAGRLVIIDGDQGGEKGRGLDVDDLTGMLRSWSEAVHLPPSLVVVDYYQKVRPPEGSLRQERKDQLQAIVDTFRRYAKGQKPGAEPTPEYAVPVLVGVQVNRDSVSGKEPEQPELHHAREADDLALDAAGVLTLLLKGERHGDSTLHVKVVKNRDGIRSRKPFKLEFYGGFNLITGEPERVIT